jgi:ATP-dependent RNA helicase DHX57
MKQQFVELLSDIGFVKEGISSRDVERAARDGGDGVIEATGQEVRKRRDLQLGCGKGC